MPDHGYRINNNYYNEEPWKKEIKPCPICKSKESLVLRMRDTSHYMLAWSYDLLCTKCEIGCRDFQSVDEAVRVWNEQPERQETDSMQLYKKRSRNQVRAIQIKNNLASDSIKELIMACIERNCAVEFTKHHDANQKYELAIAGRKILNGSYVMFPENSTSVEFISKDEFNRKYEAVAVITPFSPIGWQP